MSHKLKTEDIKIGNRLRPLPDNECPTNSNSYISNKKVELNKWYVISEIRHCSSGDCKFLEGSCPCPGRPILNNGAEICGWGAPYENFEPEPEWD